MARGSTASQGRQARSEIGSPRAGKVPAGLKTISESASNVPFIGSDGRISPAAIKEGILTIRESTGDSGPNFKDVMSDIEAELGASGKMLAAGIITDSVELAYLRKAQEQREAETPIDDIIGGKRSSARVMEQYDKDIADAEARIKEGLDDLAKASPAGKKWSKSLPNEVAKALNTIGEGYEGEKKIAKYDMKGVRVMLNDIFEGLSGDAGKTARSEIPAPPRPRTSTKQGSSAIDFSTPAREPRSPDMPGYDGTFGKRLPTYDGSLTKAPNRPQKPKNI
jgi:hypothetical protein